MRLDSVTIMAGNVATPQAFEGLSAGEPMPSASALEAAQYALLESKQGTVFQHYSRCSIAEMQETQT